MQAISLQRISRCLPYAVHLAPPRRTPRFCCSSRSLATHATPTAVTLDVDCHALLPRTPWGNNSPLACSMFRSGAVVMLNSPEALPVFFTELWTQDSFRACADGAANRLFDESTRGQSAAKLLPPNIIVGDMDSARPDVLRYYEERGCAVVRRACQDTTDMQKVLAHPAVDDARRHRGGATAVLGGLGGFLSHQMANLSELLPQSTGSGLEPLFMLGEQEICFVLRPGRTLLRHAPQHNCSLLPLYGETRVTTQGLQWNLNDQKLVFGSFVSTSNFVASETVTIDCSAPLLWVFDAHRTDRKTK